MSAVLVALVLCVAFAGAAGAALLPGPPDGSGNFVRCNINTEDQPASGTNNWQIRVACQYSDGNLADVMSAFGVTLHYSGGNVSWSPFPSPSVNSGGQYRNAFVGSGFSPGRAWDSVVSCSATINGTARQCAMLASHTQSALAPPMPTDHFAGGTDGDALDVANPPAPACARTLSQPGGTRVARFSYTASTVDAHATDAYSWAFGDGNTSALGTVAHTYTATMPDNGWTATLTLTRTAASGHYFSDGTTTKTATCALRVDFANPDQTTAGSSTGSGSEDSSSCPTGWGWLNPASIVTALQCVFIPSGSSLSDSMSSLQSDFAGSAFGSIVAPIGDLVDAWASFDSSASADPHYSGAGECDGPGASIMITPATVPGGGVQSFHPLSTCDSNVASFAATFRTIVSLLLYLGAAFVALRIVAAAIGLQLPALGGGGDES